MLTIAGGILLAVFALVVLVAIVGAIANSPGAMLGCMGIIGVALVAGAGLGLYALRDTPAFPLAVVVAAVFVWQAFMILVVEPQERPTIKDSVTGKELDPETAKDAAKRAYSRSVEPTYGITESAPPSPKGRLIERDAPRWLAQRVINWRRRWL